MKSIASLFFAALLFAACQNSYRIKGTVEGLQDGDTLFLSKDLNTSLLTDTIVVSEGAFDYHGESDSVVLALLYAQDDPNLSTTLFLDPGTIDVHLSREAGKVTIGGTAANDALQEANYLAFRYGERMQEIALSLCNTNLDSMSGMLAKSQIERLQRDLTERVIGIAERNLDNEFGYLIVANLQDDGFTPERRLQLISKMPKRYRQRSEIQTIEKGME